MPGGGHVDTGAVSDDLEQLAGSIRTIADRASRGLVERRAFVEATLLAAVAQEHVLVIGPPGTAKSQVVRQVAEAVGDRYFEYLIGKFTEPNELFGAVDLVELRAGRVVVDTTDMLPEARLAFLDEVFLGSSAILNTLLGILNERVYRRGHTVRQCPLRICVGASNDLPTEPTLEAFADRFLVRVFIDAVPDHALDDLLERGWSTSRPPTPLADTDHAGAGVLDVAAAFVERVDLTGLRPTIAQCVRVLRKHGIVLSDRRIVRSQRLIAAAAVLDGRLTATEGDLWPLMLAIPTREDQGRAEDALHDLLAQSRNRVAIAAAEDASHGADARAARLAQAAEEALAAPADDQRLLRLEGIAREIDATFAPEVLPESLAAVRARLVRELA
jgi:MoxR-like ATPase